MALQPQKKAKEYAAEFNASKKEIGDFDVIIKGLYADLRALMADRKPHTDAAARSITLEIDNKWRAIAKRCPELNPDGWMKMLKQKPEMAELLDQLGL